MGHPIAFELAERLVELSPEGLNKVFFTNSGSESVDTALKMALAITEPTVKPHALALSGAKWVTTVSALAAYLWEG